MMWMERRILTNSASITMAKTYKDSIKLQSEQENYSSKRESGERERVREREGKRNAIQVSKRKINGRN